MNLPIGFKLISSFAIFAVGEIIQLLEDIKNNTKPTDNVDKDVPLLDIKKPITNMPIGRH